MESWKNRIPIGDAGYIMESGIFITAVIVGSFLVKNLLLDWPQGKNGLMSGNACNSASWQWINCGADAAPYFRIFNPVTQGIKFDENGDYTKKFVPELKNLPNKYLFSPWECPDDILNKIKIKLGIDYPYPIVNLKESRDKALNAFASLKNEN